jgi:hypothetical protein
MDSKHDLVVEGFEPPSQISKTQPKEIDYS